MSTIVTSSDRECCPDLPLLDRFLWMGWIVFCLFYLNISEIRRAPDPILDGFALAFAGNQFLGWPRAFLYYHKWSTSGLIFDLIAWTLVLIGWNSFTRRILAQTFSEKFGALSVFFILTSIVAFCLAEPELRNYFDSTIEDRLDAACYASAALGFSFTLVLCFEYTFLVIRNRNSERGATDA